MPVSTYANTRRFVNACVVGSTSYAYLRRGQVRRSGSCAGAANRLTEHAHRRWGSLVVAHEAAYSPRVGAARSQRLVAALRNRNTRAGEKQGAYTNAVLPSGLNTIPLHLSNLSATTRTSPVSGSKRYT